MPLTPIRTPKKSTGKSKTTDDLADHLSKASLKDNSDGTNFSQSFATLHFTFRQDSKDVGIYEVPRSLMQACFATARCCRVVKSYQFCVDILMNWPLRVLLGRS